MKHTENRTYELTNHYW